MMRHHEYARDFYLARFALDRSKNEPRNYQSLSNCDEGSGVGQQIPKGPINASFAPFLLLLPLPLTLSSVMASSSLPLFS